MKMLYDGRPYCARSHQRILVAFADTKIICRRNGSYSSWPYLFLALSWQILTSRELERTPSGRRVHSKLLVPVPGAKLSHEALSKTLAHSFMMMSVQQSWPSSTKPFASSRPQRCYCRNRLNGLRHNNNSYIALYPIKIYEFAALYIINIKIHLTVKKAHSSPAFYNIHHQPVTTFTTSRYNIHHQPFTTFITSLLQHLSPVLICTVFRRNITLKHAYISLSSMRVLSEWLTSLTGYV